MPTIPAEGAYTETELHFIEAQPPGLWPENQNSNIGQFRKVLCDILQARKDEVERFSQERFVPSSTDYLSLWEEMLGVPIAISGKTVSQRRSVLESRLKWGAFSREQRALIIENLIAPTIGGTPATFGPSGIIIGSGIPLYGGGGNIESKYRVYEDQANYTYAVWIDTSNAPDIGALTRELTRVTPSGIAFTIDTTHSGTGLINWQNTITGLGPSGWWRLGADYNDYSGLGQNGTVTGAPAAIASPGLIASTGSDAARDFSGTGQYVSIADSAPLNSGFFTMRATVRPDALPGVSAYMIAYSGGVHAWIGMANFGGSYGVRFVFRTYDGTRWNEVIGTTTPVIGTTYQLAGVHDGVELKLYVNGVRENQELQTSDGIVITGPASLSGTKKIADALSGGALWNGGIDEVAFFGYPLSPEAILYLSNQARNIL